MSLHADQQRGKRFGLVACAAVSLSVLGLVGGMSLAANLGARSGSTTPSADTALLETDVLHNPPLIYEYGTDVPLEFELVCPTGGCGEVDATVTVRVAGKASLVLSESIDRGPVSFAVPKEATATGSFDYHVDFSGEDGLLAQYPAPDAYMEATSMDEAKVVDLGSASWEPAEQNIGEPVVTGAWGKGDDQFGMNPEGSGPSSFDVGSDGELVVVDRVNGRLVRVSRDGRRENLPIELSQGEPDIAVAPDGSILILNASAAPGLASIDTFSSQAGKPLSRLELPSAGNAVRRIGDAVYVEADDSWWTPVWRDGQLLERHEQGVAGVPGVPDASGSTMVLRKHLRDAGNEVRIAQSGPDGVKAWRLVGKTLLGPVVEASPLADGRVLVVQSQFDGHHSQYTVVVLGADDIQRFVIPAQNYASHYSEFSVAGTSLFQQRSSKAGYGVWRYDLGESEE